MAQVTPATYRGAMTSGVIPPVESAPSRSRIVSRARPLGLLHFANAKHWTSRDARAAFDQTSQGLLDGLVLATFRLSRTRRSDEELHEINAKAFAALELYRDAGWLADPRRAHAPQAPPAEFAITRVQEKGLDYEHLTFASRYQPHPDDPDRSRWESFEANRTVHAWLLRHPEPRPWVVSVHGATMGNPKLDLRVFRAAWVHHTLGLNVAMPVLPMHGPRRSPEGHFPSEDVLNNLHGVLQAVSDVRQTMAWIREHHEDTRIGIHGISLGGLTAGLVASLDPDLACAVLGVAPVDLVLLMERHHGTGSGYDLRVRNFEAGAHLNPMISPLKLQPAIPWERRFIYAGVVDQLVDFSDHVAPMIAHWDYPQTLLFDGGHVGIGMARAVPGFIARSFASSGLIEPRPPSRWRSQADKLRR